MGETAEDAVKREVYEETGVAYEIDHLAVIHENFFNENQGVKENMYWLPIDELDKYKAFPTFMKEYLQKEHIGVEHIVTDERK